jgi:uncharacterized integral membrane protein
VRFASWILIIAIAIGFAAFAVANREWVEVSLAPLPISFGLPLFAIIIGVLFLGALIGGAAVWFSGGKQRRLARRTRRRAGRLESELFRARAEMASTSLESQDVVPAARSEHA